MFTRKLVVVIVPLLLVALLCQVFPLFDSLGFFSNVIQGALVGAALALLLPLSGAGKRKEPFGNLLWLPAFLLVLVVGYQYGAAFLGWQAPLLSLLTTRNGQVIWIECAFIGYMTITCLRTRP